MFGLFKRRAREPHIVPPIAPGEWALGGMIRASRVLEQAQKAMAADRLDEAQALFDAAREAFPDPALRGLAETAQRKGDLPRARALWEEFSHIYPRSEFGPFGVAGIQLAEQAPDEAMATCVAAAQIFPNEPLFVMRMVNVVELFPDVRERYMDAVWHRLSQMLSGMPDNPGLLHASATMNLLEGNLEEARANYYKVWDQNAFNHDARLKYEQLTARITDLRRQAGN